MVALKLRHQHGYVTSVQLRWTTQHTTSLSSINHDMWTYIMLQ